MIGSSNVAGSFLIFSYKLLRTNIPIANVCKAFASSLSANIILSKIQLSTKITKSGGFLPDFLDHQWNLGYHW